MKKHILFFIVSGFLFCACHKAAETGNSPADFATQLTAGQRDQLMKFLNSL